MPTEQPPVVQEKQDSAKKMCTRTLALMYYPALGLLVVDFFINGFGARSVYFFVFSVLSVSGLEAGWKREDWIAAWFWINAICVTTALIVMQLTTKIADNWSLLTAPWDRLFLLFFFVLTVLYTILDQIWTAKSH